MMRKVLQFVVRQREVLAILLLFWAVVQGIQVGMGLAHGSGLHGSVIEPGTGDGSEATLVPVWPLFIQASVSAGLSCALLVSGLWRRRVKRAA